MSLSSTYVPPIWKFHHHLGCPLPQAQHGIVIHVPGHRKGERLAVPIKHLPFYHICLYGSEFPHLIYMWDYRLHSFNWHSMIMEKKGIIHCEGL